MWETLSSQTWTCAAILGLLSKSCLTTVPLSLAPLWYVLVSAHPRTKFCWEPSRTFQLFGIDHLCDCPYSIGSLFIRFIDAAETSAEISHQFRSIEHQRPTIIRNLCKRALFLRKSELTRTNYHEISRLECNAGPSPLPIILRTASSFWIKRGGTQEIQRCYHNIQMFNEIFNRMFWSVLC